MKYAFTICSALVLTLSIGQANAAVTDMASNAFEVTETAHIATTPDKVYAALITPQQWWSSEHSLSGNAANFTFDAHGGGCWCERLPNGGSAEHLVVVNAQPGKLLRLEGAIGPFQSFAVDGVMTWSLKEAAGGTDLTFTYAVSGYMKGGFEKLAPIADGVFGEQVTRLQHFIETGSPEARS